MNWYAVWILFAQQAEEGKKFVFCENCQVLFNAATANNAYEKALIWAEVHEEETGFKFFGIESVIGISDDELKDGTEIDGSFFKKKNIWDKKEKLIPKQNEIAEIVWEENLDTPIGNLMTNRQKADLKKIFKE